MNILIKNGRVIDPKNGIDAIMDLFISNGKIAQIEKDITAAADVTVDASNLWVVPGLIDLHVHLREPGFEYKETIATGTKSAAAGGFTTVCAMPNTKPVTDKAETVRFIRKKAEEEGAVHVLPVGSITMGQAGETLSDFAALREAGICALSEDGKSVPSAALMALAFEQAKTLNIPIFSHCEDLALVKNGVMNEGTVSRKLGLAGISDQSEDVIIKRDIELSQKCGAQLHICHVSTKGGVELIRNAREAGQNVTGEVCPHHFTLTDEAIDGTDANYKMNPPLRTKSDVSAIIEALRNNVITVISTDHAPHHTDEKNSGFEQAANGIVGLETAFALSLTTLVDTGVLSPSALIEKMSTNPAKVLGIDKGSLSVNACADVTIIDPNETYEIDVNAFHSKSKNSPYHGWKVKGAVKVTIVSGRIAYDNR